MSYVIRKTKKLENACQSLNEGILQQETLFDQQVCTYLEGVLDSIQMKMEEEPTSFLRLQEMALQLRHSEQINSNFDFMVGALWSATMMKTIAKEQEERQTLLEKLRRDGVTQEMFRKINQEQKVTPKKLQELWLTLGKGESFEDWLSPMTTHALLRSVSFGDTTFYSLGEEGNLALAYMENYDPLSQLRNKKKSRDSKSTLNTPQLYMVSPEKESNVG